MKIFSENKPFKKGCYILIGIVFDQPKAKRKWHKTSQLYPLCHWQMDVFTSAKHRVRVELVESCISQKTNLSKFVKSAAGCVVIMENCEMWDYKDGLMEEKIHRITFYNPCGKNAEDFLNGLTANIECDESLSSNSSWDPSVDEYALKKFKQAIRLGRYYARTKKVLSKDLKSKNELQKAMMNHFLEDDAEEDATPDYQPYITPDSDVGKDVIIGVGSVFYYDAESKREFIKIQITNAERKQRTLDVLLPKLKHDVMKNIEECVHKNLILMITNVRKNDEWYSFDSEKRNAVIFYDGHEDCDQKYGLFLKVRCILNYYINNNIYLRRIVAVRT